METYNVDRDQAYELVLNPPKKVEKVKSKEEIKAEMEREAQLMKELKEAESKKEKERIAKQLELEEKARLLDEERRLANEEYERQLEKQREAQKAIAKAEAEENARLEKLAKEARDEADRLEAEKKKAREKEQEKAKEKKKKGKKGSNVKEEEEEDEDEGLLKERDPKLKAIDSQIDIMEGVLNKLKKDYAEIETKFLKLKDQYFKYEYIRGPDVFEKLIELGAKTRSKLINRTSDYITAIDSLGQEYFQDLNSIRELSKQYNGMLDDFQSTKEKAHEYMKRLESMKLERLKLEYEIIPKSKSEKQEALSDLVKTTEKGRAAIAEFELDYARKSLRLVIKNMRVVEDDILKYKSDENKFKKQNHEYEHALSAVEQYEKAVKKGDVSITESMTRKYTLNQDFITFYNFKREELNILKKMSDEALERLKEMEKNYEEVIKNNEKFIAGKGKKGKGKQNWSELVKKFIRVVPEVRTKLDEDLKEAKRLIREQNGTSDFPNWLLNNGLPRGNLLLFLLTAASGSDVERDKAELHDVDEIIDFLENQHYYKIMDLDYKRPEEQLEWFRRKMANFSSSSSSSSSSSNVNVPPPRRTPHHRIRDLGLRRAKNFIKETAIDKPGPKPRRKRKDFGQTKPKGKGRQHNAFQYSSPDLTPKQKAAERARHYRKVKREKEEKYEVEPRQTRALQKFDAEGQPIPARLKYGTEEEKREYNRGTIKKVTLTEQEKAREEARGLKPKKETRPKKDSERKAYVGSKMKNQFITAGGNETQLKRAKRLYKEGNLSWEEIINQILH